jgi:hypothetical protein
MESQRIEALLATARIGAPAGDVRGVGEYER